MTRLSGKARRTYKPRVQTKPTTGQRPPRPVEDGDIDELALRLRALENVKLRFGWGRRRKAHTPEAGERAVRKALVLAERRAARERAYANGKRRG